jgi:adenosine kinase
MNFPSRFVNYIQPDKLHQINVSFVVDKLDKQLGGTGTNIAYNLKFFTDKKVSLLAGVGKDGDIFYQFLKEHGIATEGILKDDSVYTATGKVITDMDNNQIWGFYYGACVRGEDIDITPHVNDKTLMIISANHPKALLHFQKQAIELGVDYLYDPGMTMTAVGKEDLHEGIMNCKWFVGNDYEVSQILKMTELTLENLLEKGIVVITTLGEHGVKYQTKDQEVTVPAFTMKETKDPTGAGDAWRGGFIAGVVEGKTIEESLKQANALASFAVEEYGTVNHKPSKNEIEERVGSLK